MCFLFRNLMLQFAWIIAPPAKLRGNRKETIFNNPMSSNVQSMANNKSFGEEESEQNDAFLWDSIKEKSLSLFKLLSFFNISRVVYLFHFPFSFC